MTRPSDWWVLDLDGDPTPGSGSAIRAMARSWGNLADDAEYAKSRIASLLGDGAIGAWIGEAGEAFRDKTGDLPKQLGQCCESYRLASEALTWWAGRLEGHQHDADHALVLGRAAREDLEAAKQRAQAAAAAATAAGNAGVLSPTAVEPDPDKVRAATQRLHAAQAASSAADGDVAAAQSRLDAARSMALDAKSLRESDGRTAAGRIHEASDAGIPERSRWEKFKDWAGEAWDVIVKIAKVVVAVLGVVALIIGGPLAWVVFAAALLVLADTIMKYVQGKASLWDVAFAAISCIPGTKGLTTLAELKTAFQAGGLLGAGLHVLSAGKTAIAEMAQGVRALGSGLRTSMVGFLDRGLVRMDGLLLDTKCAEGWMDVRSVVHRLRGGSFTDSGDLVIRRWTPVGEPGPLGTGFPADTFRSMSYDEVMLRHDTTLHRVMNDRSAANGLFWTADAPVGPLESQLNLALMPEWRVDTVNGVTVTGPQATHYVTADFPAGTTIFQGPTAPQFSDGISTIADGHTNVHIPGSILGGGVQIVPDMNLMNNWREGIVTDVDMNLQGPFPVGGS